MASDSIKIHIGAKDAASAVIQGVQARTIALGVAIGNLASKAIVGMLNSMRGWVSEALEAEKANVMLDAALRGAGQYTPELAKQYRDLANAIQDETGASDESVKANIAQLTTLGVTSEKMAVAARSVSALAAVGRDGSMAMNAVARALNGDVAGFERLSPAVRNATTISEKYAAVNQMLAAGYEQQQAKLQTVGGAWEALKGRIGDAREDIIGAIFEGLKLGTTFNTMQASVGKFLKSDTFSGFTEALRNGAGYALEIAKAMTADGGAKDVVSALGNVIIAALKDGADYIGNQIRNALGAGKVAGAGKFWGALSTGAGVSKSVEAMNAPDATGGKGGRLDVELAKLKASITVNAKKVEEQAAAVDDGTDEYLAYLAEQKQSDDQSIAMKQAAVLAQKKVVATEKAKVAAVEKTLAWEAMIEGFAKEEADAKSKVARNQQRLNALASQNVTEYIAAASQKRESERDRAKEERKTRRKLDNLEGKEARGVNMSKRDREMLQDARDQAALRKAANDAMIQGRKDEIEARRLKEAGEADLKRQRAKNEKNIARIAESVDSSLEVGN